MSEFLPEGEVVVSEALPVLGKVGALLFIVGCIHVLDGFTRALFGSVSGAVGWIPWLGHVATKPIHKIEQKITSALGRAERGFDKQIGTSWHKLGHIARHLARELEGQAALLWAIAGVLAHLTNYKTVLRLLRAATHPLRAAQHVLHRAQHALDHRQRAVAHTVVKGIYPRLRADERALGHVIEWDIPHLRSRSRTLEREYDRLHKWLRSRPWDHPTKAFVGAVAVALALLGGSWIRCSKWRNAGKRVCHFPGSFLEGLLGVAFAFMVVADPVPIGRGAVKAADLMDDVIRRIAEPSATVTRITDEVVTLLVGDH